jgi:hypothetical protein
MLDRYREIDVSLHLSIRLFRSHCDHSIIFSDIDALSIGAVIDRATSNFAYAF